MITSRTRVFALLGRPVAHSRSPLLHNSWFAAHGIDAVYVALEPPDGADLRSLIGSLAGANLTTPLKRSAVALLTTASDEVRATGAVNTVLVASDGALHGHNTDVWGLDASLPAIRPGGGVVLGAGGAARAAVRVMRHRGLAPITVLARDPERARELALEAGPGVSTGSLDPTSWAMAAAGATLVVNATTAGARPAIQALDPAHLDPGATWCDLNYWDADPPGFARCRATGRTTVDGWGMLALQAARAFELFTGIAPSGREVREARSVLVPPLVARERGPL